MQPAPKRAKPTTKPGQNSDSTACSTNQQSTDTAIDLIDITTEVHETDIAPDDTLSLFGGLDFDDTDNDPDNDNLLSAIAQDLCSK